MNSKDFTKLIMNPVRMRIIQHFIIHHEATAAQVGGDLSDVPRASLYRHIKLLENAGLLTVVQENKKRGTVEKVYRLNQNFPTGVQNPRQEEIAGMVQNILLSIMSEFRRYFEQAHVDYRKDQVAVSSSTLLLSDEEFTDFLERLSQLFGSVLENKPDGSRKPRRITFISSPVMNGREHKEEQ